MLGGNRPTSVDGPKPPHAVNLKGSLQAGLRTRERASFKDASSNAFPWLKPQWPCVARSNSPTVAGAVPDLLQTMLTGFPFICVALD